jgi:cation diffusion facilitator CzcD-associated flavoprotein CzcO
MRVIIVGAGFGGIAAAIELRKHGIDDITILEAAPGVGGTWFHNSYPGAACDVPSNLYSFSFAQETSWSAMCAPQSEILAYLEKVTREFGIAPLVRTGTRVTRCAFDDTARRWTVEVADGEPLQADAVIIATGQLHQPALPKIPGIETFAGRAFHSAQWDHDYPLAGKRVAVVGTGASAVQFVPEIATEVAHLTVFQRSGNWFMPRLNRPYPGFYRWLIAHLPGLQPGLRVFWWHYGELLTRMIRSPERIGKLGRARSTRFMRRQIKDPALREQLWPDYQFGCKRVLFSSRWLPALQRPNVAVVTEAVTAVDQTGVIAADGAHHAVDCIIYGTGFRTTQFMFPMEIEGAGGASLRESWAGGAHAHLGMTIPGFPSLFVMYGPNTNTSGGSIVWYLEQQAGYIRQALELVRARAAAAIAVRPEVEIASDTATQAAFAGTAWLLCNSWYQTDTGRQVTNWPLLMGDYRDAVQTLNPDDFELLEASA